MTGSEYHPVSFNEKHEALLSKGWCLNLNKVAVIGTKQQFLCQIPFMINAFTPDSAKSKIDRFSKITNWIRVIRGITRE